MSKDGDITLKELATLRIDEFTKAHTRYEEAMKSFNKMASNDSKPGGENQGFYPMGLIKVSQEIHEGTLAYCQAGKFLAEDYAKFSKDPSFCKRYQERIDYIDIIKEDLAAAMQTLHDKLDNVPIYKASLVAGDLLIKDLNIRLDATKHFMRNNMNRTKIYQEITPPPNTPTHVDNMALNPDAPKSRGPQR